MIRVFSPLHSSDFNLESKTFLEVVAYVRERKGKMSDSDVLQSHDKIKYYSKERVLASY